jgi:hypothetical protein
MELGQGRAGPCAHTTARSTCARRKNTLPSKGTLLLIIITPHLCLLQLW